MKIAERIEQANAVAVERLRAAEPVLIDVERADEAVPELASGIVLHAGPPVPWEQMCGPLRGAIVGALRYENLASAEEEVESLVARGRVMLGDNHSRGVVGPMAGVVTRSMPVFKVLNRTYGNVAYVPINEGVGKVLRFGANDEHVVARLQWIERTLGPALKAAIRRAGGIDLGVIIARALTMGDELHQRNVAASLLLARQLLPHLIQADLSEPAKSSVIDFILGNEQFFLNLAMAAAKASADPASGIDFSTVVTAMSRNGTTFGIRVSGLGNQWWTAQSEVPRGLYFPGYSHVDANPDMGDSAIVETVGLGGFSMAAAPAVVRFLGIDSSVDALRVTREMEEITLSMSAKYLLPPLNFTGAPLGIDIRKVVRTGIAPVINTGIAHRHAGIGQIGAGIVQAPLGAFEAALEAFSSTHEGSGD